MLFVRQCTVYICRPHSGLNLPYMTTFIKESAVNCSGRNIVSHPLAARKAARMSTHIGIWVIGSEVSGELGEC